ncbi:MAG: hypothetical protein K5787_00450 [Lentisphaeria bacterium]|nr:hypothetical protein [Lentisphaeria bacterium]
MKKAVIAFIMLAALFATTIKAQTQIAGGESYALNGLPANLLVTMNVGENRIFTLEENLAVGLWSARPSNPQQQILITHQIQDATGGVAIAQGTATIQIIGAVASDSNVDFVLSKPGAPVGTVPAAVIRCRVVAVAQQPIVVQQQPVVVAQQPVVVPQPIIAPPQPSRPIHLENEYYYEMPQIPQFAEFRLRQTGGEITFYLECRTREGFEWNAICDNDKLQVIIDNDYHGPARRFGHKNPRETHGARIQVTGFDPCDTRLILEYRKTHHNGRADRPIKIMTCMVKVR